MNIMLGRILCAACLALILCAPPLAAQDQPANHKTRTMEGGVKGTAIPYDEGVEFISTSTKAVETSTEQIVREATRKDEVMVRGPNVLPNGTILNPINIPMSGMPIRKDKLKRWMAITTDNLQLLKTYADGLVIPASKAQAAQDDYDQLRKAVDFAGLHFDRLKDLTSQKNLDNEKIARQALFVHDAMVDVRRRLAALSVIIYGSSDSQTPPDATTLKKTTVIHSDSASRKGVVSSTTAKSTSETVTTESSK